MEIWVSILGGGLKIFYFHPYLGKITILTIYYFSKGLVQPPTSICLFFLGVVSRIPL